MIQRTATLKEAHELIVGEKWGDTPRVLVALAHGVTVVIPAGTTIEQLREATSAMVAVTIEKKEETAAE